MKKIVFICLGNICRSPLAEGIARDLIKQMNLDIEVDSAGISGYHRGEPPHELSQQVAREMGLDISDLKSSKVSPYMQADLFVAMDNQNIRDLLALGIDKKKIIKLGDYGLCGKEIPDPYYKGIDGFYEIRDLLKVSITEFLKDISCKNFE